MTTTVPAPQFLIPRMIEKKRDGGAFTSEEIDRLIEAVTSGQAQGTQLGALLMAVYLRSMTLDETIWLTAAMVRSGEVLAWPEEWRGLVADKHSTGGVGDKVSLPLAPALAACGLKVPMISGRGLGHTGGTLDKLESIPGFQVSQSRQGMIDIMTEAGCCIVGQTENIVPADKILYATRDITGTVGSVPLIAASIISKKAAENLDSLVLDIKTGTGAVLADEGEARELAHTMVGISNGLGIKTKAVVTDMSNPIGYMIGNSLEIAESLDCLRGKGPEDLRELVTYLGGELLVTHHMASTVEEGAALIASKLDDGSALERFRRMAITQGVDKQEADMLCDGTGEGGNGVLPKAEYQTPVLATETGYVDSINSMACARTSCALGAGRTKWGDQIDYSVGLELLVAAGSSVKKGEPWMIVHHSSPLEQAHLTTLSSALSVSELPPTGTTSRIKDVITQ